jgi:hypothetical protein
MSVNSNPRISSPPRSFQPAAEIVDVTAIVVGPDLLLTELRDGRMVLHHLAPDGHLRELGTFSEVADAWAAVDEVELAGGLALAA